MHDVLVRDVAIRENHLLDLMGFDQGLKLFFRMDGNSFGVEAPRKNGRVFSSLDIRDLSRGESDDPAIGIIAKNDIEIVEVSTRGSHDEHFQRHDDSFSRITRFCL
jgi:hypothetical protein